MDIQEKLSYFDYYVESINGLSHAMKAGVSQLARAVLEAELGENPEIVTESATEGSDLADEVKLPALIDTLNAAIDPNNPTMLPLDIKATAMNVVINIDKLTEKLANDSTQEYRDCSKADSLMQTFPDLGPRLDALNEENKEIQQQAAGSMTSISPEDFGQMRETIDRNRKEIANLRALKSIFAEIRNAITRYKTAANDANYTNARARVNNMEIERIQTLQGTNKPVKETPTAPKVKPMEPIGETIKTKLNSLIGACHHYEADISNLLLAIQDQNKAVRAGKPVSVQDCLNARHKKVNKSVIAADTEGAAVFKIGDVYIPLRVAYEMAHDGVKVVVQDQFVFLAEDFNHNGKRHAEWNVVFDTHFGEFVAISIGKTDKFGQIITSDSQRPTTVPASEPYKIIAEAFYSLANEVTKVIPLRASKR